MFSEITPYTIDEHRRKTSTIALWIIRIIKKLDENETVQIYGVR